MPTLNEKMDANGVYPLAGDCYCFAAAVQKIADEKAKHTAIVCVKKEPYGSIGHCMLQDLDERSYYDVDGKQDGEEALEKFKEYVDECGDELSDEGWFIDECYDDSVYYDKYMANKECKDGKIERIERMLRCDPPEWLKDLEASIRRRDG